MDPPISWVANPLCPCKPCSFPWSFSFLFSVVQLQQVRAYSRCVCMGNGLGLDRILLQRAEFALVSDEAASEQTKELKRTQNTACDSRPDAKAR